VRRDAQQFDVAIVGARCAGSPLAAMLASRGLRVCVLDRSQFPSDTLSTHVIQPCGVAILRRLGVLDAVLAAGAVPLTRFTLLTEDARIDAELDAQVKAFGAPGLCVRRVTLDHLLVQAAAAAGADVRTGSGVTSLLQEDGLVTGVETENGPVRARLVVGADGRRSSVASLVGAAEYHVAPPGRLFAWAYFEGVTNTEARLRLGRLGDLAFLASPTDSGLYLAGACPALRAKATFLADRERSFMAGLGVWPELADLLAGATRVGPIRVMGHWHGYFRKAVGRGWALLGDAGHFKDPTPAQGISDALRQAEHLADAVEAGLGGAVSIDEELGRWWRWRDQDAYEMHWFAADLGAAGPSGPLHVQIIRDIAGDHEATENLLRVLNHDLRPSQLFRPGRLGKAAARAARDRPDQIPVMMKEVAVALRDQVRRSIRHAPAPPPARNQGRVAIHACESTR
jgi:2-polyprenyl-6-methoxyphenol hydroxylase-like FAD-dependent oxidoreductase